MNWKDMGQIVALISIVTSVLMGYIYLDARHAHQEEVIAMELELMADMLDMDIDKDAELVNYYRTREIQSVREPSVALIEAEQVRYEYVQGEIERKTRKKEKIEAKLIELGRPRSID